MVEVNEIIFQWIFLWKDEYKYAVAKARLRIKTVLIIIYKHGICVYVLNICLKGRIAERDIPSTSSLSKWLGQSEARSQGLLLGLT